MHDTTALAHKPGTLQRSMKMLGTLLITLSAVTPASSVFIIIPGIIGTAGTGAFLSMVIAAFIGVCMALVYAELSSAYPLTGGEYAIVGRVVGPMAGFIVMGVNLVSSVLIPAVMALGMSTYLGVLFPNLPMIPTAIATVALADSHRYSQHPFQRHSHRHLPGHRDSGSCGPGLARRLPCRPPDHRSHRPPGHPQQRPSHPRPLRRHRHGHLRRHLRL